MKISSTKKAAILATVLSGFVLGSSAEAAKLGVVTASDYVTSHMGALEGSFINSDDIYSVKSVITGLNRDPAVYNTVDPVTGKSSLFIRQYTYSTVNLQDSYAFDAQGDWSNRVAGNTSDATNAHDVARYKDFVYVASYDEGTIGVAKITDSVISDQTAFTRDLKKDLELYDDVVFADKNASLHGEGVVIIDDNLYVIANVNPKGGYAPYDPSYLIKYVIKEDGRLSYDGYTTMGKNTDTVALNVYNNYMLSTAIGGYQYYGAENSNAETSIDVVTLDPVSKRFTDTRQINLPENLLQVRDGKTIPKSEFRSLKVMPNGTAYVMTYNIGRAGKNVDVTVYQTTVSNLLSTQPQNWKEVYREEAAPGWFGRLDAEYNTKRLWVQVGNKLNIYTDGATTPLSFGTDSFAANKMYEELYTWDIIRTDVIPEGNLVTLQLAEGEVSYNPNALAWKDGGNQIDAIHNVGYKDITTNNNVITLGKDVEGNLTNNILAGIYAEDTASKINVNNGLQIQVENNIASPVGIYAGDSSTLKVNAANGNVNIITKTMEGGNTLTNAIWLDPSKNGGESITVESLATNITMEGGYGGNGVAIQKTDRWGENSKASTNGGNITIKGDLNIKGADNETWGIGANPENVLSRFNNAGILVDVNNSSVTVDGNVDMDVYGNGVTVTGANSTVTITKGGSITVPTGTGYGYYALAAYDGTINMNADATANAVKIDGDIFALEDATIKLGLATGDSYLKGIIDNGGTVELTLKNGAQWYNEANNTRYEQDNEDYGNGEQSKVTLLTGGDSLAQAGTIIQTANSKLLEIDKLSGAVNVKYYHDGINPTVILGGDVKIVKATQGSNICLITNGGFDTTDTELVNQVLDSLANKLYYIGYATNPYNLKGIVGIGEGLTSSSLTKIANIKFDTESGQGSRSDGTGDDDAPVVIPGPVHPGKDTSENYNAKWEDVNEKGNVVIITNNNSINVIAEKNVLAAYNNVALEVDNDRLGYDKHNIQIESDTYAPVAFYCNDVEYMIDEWGGMGDCYMQNYDLNNVKNTNPTYGQNVPINIITKVPNGSSIKTNAIWLETVMSPDPDNIWTMQTLEFSHNDVNITMLGGNGGNGVALTSGIGAENEDEMQASMKSIKFYECLSVKGESYNQWGIGNNNEATNARENSTGILVTHNGSSVIVDGSVYMDVCGNGITVDANYTDSLKESWIGGNVSVGCGDFQNGNLSNIKGSQILVPNGDEDHQYYSLYAEKGKILVDNAPSIKNWAMTQTYTPECVRKGGQFDGDWYLGGDGATIDVGVNGTDAYFNGAVDNNGGTANLYLVDGATWTNLSTNGLDDVSHITNFRGNNKTGGKAAQIIQYADSGDIVIDNYYGDTKVYYTYDANKPYEFKGGDIKINHAEADSKITLHTNYTTAIQWGNLEYVLNGLASKLYYLGYVGENGEDNLTACLSIDEGLTTSKIDVEILKKAEILNADGTTINSNVGNENITFDPGNVSINAGVQFDKVTGQGSLGASAGDDSENEYDDLVEEVVPDGYETPPNFVVNGAYTKPIYGVVGKDLAYLKEGIRSGGVYNFNEAVTFNTSNNKVDAGPWMGTQIGGAIFAHGNLQNAEEVHKTTINLNGNALNITDVTEGASASIAAIDRGIVELNDAGKININQTGYGMTAGIFANGGGEVYIHNTGDNVVTIRSSAASEGASENYTKSGVGIKAMNGDKDTRSKIVIDGLVDVVADATKYSNEAISAVAGTIEVGGGKIEAINGAWAAIRAYGEFVSTNTSVVNVNVVKQTDKDGNVIKDAQDTNIDLIAGAGNNKTNILGDFVTNGGMGTKGNISVGLGTADSSWIGNYADATGYGVTKGMEGQVNLYMKNGADWTGFADGDIHVTMEGKGTTWYGFNLCDTKQFTGTDAFEKPFDYYAGGLDLNLLDGALWINAISTKQLTPDGKQADSKVFNFNGAGGFIDMTGRNTFLGINNVNHAEGSDGLSSQNTKIQEYGDKYETGNIVITNYSGDTTVIYRRDANNITNVLGGTTTIKNATLGSKITLSTDGYGMTNNQVAETLDNLAEKLYYTAYVNGERNLKGYVQIAEGLTTESVGKHVGSIVYNSATGQGSLNKDSLGFDVTPPSGGDEDDNTQGGGTGGTTPEVPEDKPVEPEKVEKEFTGGISGDFATDETYKDLVNEDGALDFGKLEAAEGEVIGSVKLEVKDSTEAGTNNSAIVGTTDAYGNSKPVVIEMNGLNLNIGTSASGKDAQAHGIVADGADVTINNAGNITIKSSATGEGGTASAIFANGNDVVIDNAENKGTVELKADSKVDGVAVLHAQDNANVNITGKVNITDTKGNTAINVGTGSTVAIGGGVIGDEATSENEANVAIHIDGGKLSINANSDETVVINGKIVLGKAPARTLRMSRAITVPTETEINFTDKESSLNDDVQYLGSGENDFAIKLSNGATWTGNSTGGVDLDVILADGGAWTGYHEDETGNTLSMEIKKGAIWTNTAKENDATTINSLSGNGGYIQMSDKTGTHLNVEQYSGNTTIMYNHDEKTPTNILGGDVTIKAATAGSNITLHTDSIGTSKQEEVKKVLDALAQKLTYTNHNDGNLTGTVQILEGMTTSSAMRKGEIVFGTDGKGNLNTSKDIVVENTYTGDYIYGDSETAMMKGAKSAMASTVMMWRSESNDLLQRMGDVRLATEESGVWAKYYGGKYEMDAQNTNFSTNYKAYQVGYDKAVGNGWNVGVAVSHNEGDSRYDRGGEGEMTVTSLSVYGNKDYGDGRYLGLIFKGSQLKNEYEVFNNDGYKLEGDFKTWGTSISAEYGKRIEKGNGFYFDPSVELTIGHVQGKDYTATSDLLKNYGKTATMQVEQDDFNSIIGRVGFGIGQRTERASYYAKLALAHEFGGDFDTHYTAEETKGTNIDFGDTWYEMQLGGTAKLSDNSLLYATYERSFGGDVTEKWRVDAGLRISF